MPRSESCPECDADIRACRSCIHWSQDSRTCREPNAEVPADPEKQNFCSFFQIGAPRGSGADDDPAPPPESAKQDAMRRLEALFGKK